MRIKNPQKIKEFKRLRRRKRTRVKIYGKNNLPRLSVFRSLKHIYAQLIDDEKGVTLISANDRELKSFEQFLKEETKLSGKTKIAFLVGEILAMKALKKNIKKVIFDRAHYKYHGRIKALAEGARKGGLMF